MGENVQNCKSLPFIDKVKNKQGLIAQIDSLQTVFKLEIRLFQLLKRASKV